MLRFEASVLASLVFCLTWVTGSNIFQIAVDAKQESMFPKAGIVYMFALFVIEGDMKQFLVQFVNKTGENHLNDWNNSLSSKPRMSNCVSVGQWC
ncbi:hypothetical protein TNCV_3022141 [Trichonephila clavipes]|nr:hypothetical protein TNCV_3022141 [Trichonephila clavipes]